MKIDVGFLVFGITLALIALVFQVSWLFTIGAAFIIAAIIGLARGERE